MLARLQRIPDARAAVSRTIFFAGFGGTRRTIEAEGVETVPAGGSPSFYAAVTPGYFSVFSVPLIAGRDFAGTADDSTVIVNETMARRIWPAAAPLGRRIRFGADGSWRTIVGVVRDFGGGPLGSAASSFAYVPFEAAGTGRDLAITASASRGAEALIPEIRSAVRGVDPDQPIEDVKSMEAAYAAWASPARFVAILMTSLAAIALALASIGTYGVIAYGVSQRMRELGIRVALGASSAQISRMVTGSALRLGFVAVLLGVPGAWLATRALEGVLFGTSPRDPLVFALTPLLLLAVALLSGWQPSRRAARVDPAITLRST